MKIRFSMLMALVAVLLGGALSSCAPEEITRVPAKVSLENADEMGAVALTFSNRVETKSVTFTADGDWYIRIPKECDWLKASPASGTGDATVNFTTSLYEEEVPRDVKVAFVCDDLEQKAILNVTQLQKFYIEPSILSSVLPKTGGEATVSVTTNGTFTCNLDAEGAKWLSVVSQTGNEVVLNAEPIAATASKNLATLTFTCVEDPGVQAVLNLSQKNLAITLQGAEALVDSNGGSAEVSVSTLNVNSWRIESDQTWVKAEKSGDKVVFTVEPNTVSTERTALISVICDDSADDSDVKGILSVTQYPAADLVDFKFSEDGTAVDVSPRQNTIRSYTKAVKMNYYEEYASWGPTVSRTANSSPKLDAQAIWFCEYTSFEDKINDGYTIESVFSIPAAHTNVETKAFGATKSGGFALMLGSTGAKTNTDGTKVTRDGSIEFIQHDGTNWTFGVTGVKPVPGQLYHVFGVWDGEAFLCYVDGELKYSGVVKKLKHATMTPHHLAVTGNYNGETSFNGAWNGSVVVARMYDSPLTAEQVAAKTELNGKIKIVK